MGLLHNIDIHMKTLPTGALTMSADISIPQDGNIDSYSDPVPAVTVVVFQVQAEQNRGRKRRQFKMFFPTQLNLV